MDDDAQDETLDARQARETLKDLMELRSTNWATGIT